MSLLDDITKIKKGIDTKYVMVYSDGSVREDDANRIANQKRLTYDAFGDISYEIRTGFEHYAGLGVDVEEINLGMILGVMYKPEDVNEDKSLKEGAKPVSDEVHFYTMDLTCVDEKGQTKQDRYNEARLRHQGFIGFSEFVSKAKKEGLQYEGPSTFSELVEGITTGQKQDINLKISLAETKEETQAKEAKPVQKRKGFFR